MGQCASYWLAVLSPPTFSVLLRGSEARLGRSQDICPLPAGLRLNSANRWCWRRQQEERRRQGVFLSLLCVVSAQMGVRCPGGGSPAATCSGGSGKSQKPISSCLPSAACSCSCRFPSNTRTGLLRREGPPVGSQVPDSHFLQPRGAGSFLRSVPCHTSEFSLTSLHNELFDFYFYLVNNALY